MDNPPVNAMPVAGWFEIADHVTRAGRHRARAWCRAARRGTRLQRRRRHQGDAADRRVHRAARGQPGCFAAFKAVYECAVPVIAAVNGFCLGGGIGLVGNSDVIIAAEDATFGLPEVDRGALGAATHLSRLVPQHKMRAMVYTSATATAAELHALRVGALGRAARRSSASAALELADEIAAKDPVVIRAAKESLNGIDLWDVNRSYRYEQGFTFELNLTGVSDKARDEFVAAARHRRGTERQKAS